LYREQVTLPGLKSWHEGSPARLPAGRQRIASAKPACSGASRRLCFPAVLRPIPREQSRNHKFIAGQTTAQHWASLTSATGELETWRCPAPHEKSSEGCCISASGSAQHKPRALHPGDLQILGEEYVPGGCS